MQLKSGIKSIIYSPEIVSDISLTRTTRQKCGRRKCYRLNAPFLEKVINRKIKYLSQYDLPLRVCELLHLKPSQLQKKWKRNTIPFFYNPLFCSSVVAFVMTVPYGLQTSASSSAIFCYSFHKNAICFIEHFTCHRSSNHILANLANTHSTQNLPPLPILHDKPISVHSSLPYKPGPPPYTFREASQLTFHPATFNSPTSLESLINVS